MLTEPLQSALSRPPACSRHLKLKPPCFDGKTSFDVFKLQFETAAAGNNWDETDKANSLIVVLQGNAAETLQTVPESDRKNYEYIMDGLKRRFGNEHKRNIHHFELKSRVQKYGETLQEYAADFERLAQLVYAEETNGILEQTKIWSFVQGIRDHEIKMATLVASKSTLVEAVGFALAHEAAKIMCQPYPKVRQVQMSQEDSIQPYDFCCETAKVDFQASDVQRQMFKGKCFVCDKVGHIARYCKLRRKREESQATTNIRNSSTTFTDSSLN